MYNIKKQLAILLSFIMMFSMMFESFPFHSFVSNVKAANSNNGQSARLIIKYKNDAKENSVKIRNSAKQKSKKVNNRKINNKVEILEIEQAENVGDIIRDLENIEEVDYVQEDFQLEILGLPNDPELQNQWGILNNGQKINGLYGVEGIDINVAPIWENEDELSEVLVAVLDTGIDTSHYDLKSRMHEEGWNFVDGNNDVTKDADHGTGVTGVIAAEHNDRGIAGIANNVKILPVKFIENGAGYTSDAIAGILYAKEKGVKIVNCSFGSPNYNQALYDVMKDNQDLLFVCAAGNSGSYGGMYPAAFELPNVISVASINNRGELSATSNYGDGITIAAPGDNILTTITGDEYGYTSGTSMSVAFVSGAVAIYSGKYPEKSAAEIKVAIKQSARLINGLDGMVETSGALDIEMLLKKTDIMVEIEEGDEEIPVVDEDDGENFEEKFKYLMNDGLYSDLEQNEKERLCLLFGVFNETMELYEDLGYKVGKSIYRAFIKEKLNISVDEVESFIENVGGINKAYSTVNKLNKYISQNPDYFKDDMELIKNFILNGYTPFQLLHSLIISKMLEIDIYRIIAEKDKFIDINIEYFDNEKQIKSLMIARKYGIKLSFLIEHLDSNNLTLEEFTENLTNYQHSNDVLFENDKEIQVLSENLEMNKYTDSTVYSYKKYADDYVNLKSGSLIHTSTDIVIPGINGLDLIIGSHYNTDENTMHNISLVTDNTMPYGKKYISTPKPKSQGLLYNFARGWSFNFSAIFFDDNKNYLTLSDGSILQFSNSYSSSNNEYTLQGYKLRDIILKNDNGSYQDSRANSKYALCYKDGTTEYFDNAGNLMSIEDRYGNIIKFEYVTNGNEVNIIDSMERTVNIKRTNLSNGAKIEILLPDENKIIYNIVYGLDSASGYSYEYLDNKIDQKESKKTNQAEQLKTKYSYKFASNAGFYCYYYAPSGAKIGNCILTSVEYPTGAKTEYEHSTVHPRFSEDGMSFSLNYELVNKCEKENNSIYNKIEYDSRYIDANYPSHNYPNLRKVSYASGKEEIYDLHDDGRVRQKITKSGNKPESTIYYQYHTANHLPGIIIMMVHGNNATMTTEHRYYYDSGNYGDLEISRDMQISDNPQIQTTSYYYDNTYHLMTSKTIRKDSNTIIEKEYTLTDDNKSISSFKEFENGTQKSRIDFEYNSSGNITSKNEYKDASSCIDTTYSYNYGSGGKLLITETKNDVDGSRKLSYDEIGRLTTETDYNGVTKKYEYDNLGRRTKTTVTSDNSLNVENYGASNVVVENISYNDSKNEITDNLTGVVYNFDGLGNIKNVVDQGSTVKTYSYDTAMRLTNEQDGRSGKISYVYDSLDRLTNKQALNSAGSVLYEEQYVYEPAYDSETSKITKTVIGDSNSPNIKTTQYINKLGQTVKAGRFNGSVEYYDTFKYDYLGNTVEMLNEKDRANGKTWSEIYTYDHAGRVTSTKNWAFNADTTEYDYLGRVTKAVNSGVTTTYTYDNLSRVKKESRPYGTLSYDYSLNGNFGLRTVTKTDALDAVTQYMYDKLDRLAIVKTDDGNGNTNYTSYKYNALGNVTQMHTGLNRSAPFDSPSTLNSVLTSEGQLTKYTYDNVGRLKSIIDPLNQTESYKYDVVGNMTEKTDRNGNTITNTYDNMNRLTKTTGRLPNGTTAPEFVEYTYSKTGLTAQLKNETMTIGYTYDSLGRLIKETEPNGVEKNYGYDPLNNRTSFDLKRNGATELNLSYTYDKAISAPTMVTDLASSISADYSYSDNGLLASITRTNNVIILMTEKIFHA